MDPKPVENATSSLCSTYYTHSDKVTRGFAGELRDRMLEYIWQWQFHYELERKFSLAVRLLARLPLVSEAAGAKVMYLRSRHGGHILDVGCGSGVFVTRMRGLGWDVEAVKPDMKAATVMLEKNITHKMLICATTSDNIVSAGAVFLGVGVV